MTDLKISLPEGLVTQKPKVAEDDQILILAKNSANDFDGALATVEDSEPDYEGDIHVECGKGCYVNSWAVVNGPVKPGDKVIALEFAFAPKGNDVKVVGGIYPVILSYDIWAEVQLPGDMSCLLTRWAKLEGENENLPVVGETIPEPAKPEPKFKVGDRVKIMKSGYISHSSRQDGGVGTVTKIYDQFLVRVLPDDAPDGADWSFFVEEIELLAEEPKVDLRIGFKVGDRVRMTDGRLGTVTALWGEPTYIGDAHSPVQVKPDGDEIKLWSNGTGAVLVTDEPTEKLYTEAQLRKKLAGNKQALQVLGLMPEEKDVLTDVTVSAVKDAEGDVWIQSFELFGDLLFRFTGDDEGPDSLNALTYEELWNEFGPLSKVEA